MQERPDELLQTITELSHEFGTPDFVKGGGGNTSAKSGDLLYIKPSGTTLGSLAPDRFVALDRGLLGAVYTADIPSDPHEREAVVLDLMLAAVLPGQDLRPSVESPMHDILDKTFVVHTHSVLTNGMTCAVNGPAAGARLFPDALWVPYIDPGFTLCRELRERVSVFIREHGRTPTTIFLDNHGVVVSGNSAEEIRDAHNHLIDTLKQEYAALGISTDLRFGSAGKDAEIVRTRNAIETCLGEDGAFVCHDRICAVAEGPISPDHIVYSQAYPYLGEVTAEGVDAFQKEHGYKPRVFSSEHGVFSAAATEKKAVLALALARDGAQIQQLAQAFGGVEFLTDAQRIFIEEWEVEAFRAKQLG
jgi:rhamnose utilization protein RhaD (predicted bifunctional aldolase and dehydrogenase)